MSSLAKPLIALMGIALSTLVHGELKAQPQPEPTLDQTLAAYDQARGGVAAWRQIRGLSMEGTYASFSERHPFTLDLLRPGFYYFETTSLRGRMVHAVDDKGPWWIMPAIGDPLWSRRVAAPSDRLVTRASLFEPPLLDVKSKGHTVKWLGPGDVDGQPTWDLELVLATGEREVWHLDRTTFLEVAIDATTFDFTQKGEAIAERSYFEDFRPVQSIVLPHKILREYLARYTSLEIAKVVVDPPQLSPARFAYQLSPGMAKLQKLHGRHQVRFEIPGRPNAPWQSFTGEAEITPLLDGAVLDENLRVEIFGSLQQTLRRWAFDRGDELFRITQVDDVAVAPSIFVGKLEGEIIRVDNLVSQSGARDGATETYERWTLTDLGAEGFRIEADQSSDEGKTWSPAWRATYSAKAP